MKKFVLELVVFLCGASVMILEIDGSRILAPYLGSSIIVWTSIIGVILGSMSLGYWLGGRIADKKASVSSLGSIIFAAGAAIGLLAVIKDPLLTLTTQKMVNIQLNSVVASMIIFAIPSILLGIVSPYAVKLKSNDIQKVGQTTGNLYAFSTIGSIVGTFLAGFWLIPMLGNTNILYFLAGLLLVASLVTRFTFFKSVLTGFLVIVIFLSNLNFHLPINMLADIDTRYGRFQVLEAGNNIRVLKTDRLTAQSYVNIANPEDLLGTYLGYFDLISHFEPEFKSSLMIGGGGYAYPRSYLVKYPEATMDIVEIDSKLTLLAKKYFDFNPNPQLKIINEDGRVFLNENKKIYDTVLLDAFNSLTPPHQLMTLEAFRKMSDALSLSGVLIVNSVGSLVGEEGRLLQSQIATIKAVFPQVLVFPTANNEKGIQNIMIVGLKSPEPVKLSSKDEKIQNYLNHFFPDKGNGKVLTDNHSPVEYYSLAITKSLFVRDN